MHVYMYYAIQQQLGKHKFHETFFKFTVNGTYYSAVLDKYVFGKCREGQNREVGYRNIAGMANVLSVIYMTLYNCAALYVGKTTICKMANLRSVLP